MDKHSKGIFAHKKYNSLTSDIVARDQPKKMQKHRNQYKI